MLMRTLLFVPAHKKELLGKALNSNADVVLPDLEDAIPPKENKEIARLNIIEKIKNKKDKYPLVFPRINDRESGELLKDLQALTQKGIDGFVYPKACSGQDVSHIDKLLEVIEKEKNLEIGTFKLIILIETTSAIVNLKEICLASKRTVAIAFGCEDYLTDLQGLNDPEGISLNFPRSIISITARACKIIPIDTVHTKVHDLVDLERNLKIAKNLGFEGMLTLSPREIPLIHRYFSPSEEEIQRCQEILKLSKEENKDSGVFVSKNYFIGPPIVKMAEKTLKRQTLIEKREQKR